ncbi:hypothetical protein [Microbulbifer yueqingensis]|nr:hypothetical protein [Microbulbifer yueqingensis]
MRNTQSEQAAFEHPLHPGGHRCSACSELEADVELLQALRGMPVPAPGDGFEARMLAGALQARVAPGFRPLRWPLAAAAILLLGLSFAVSVLTQWGRPAGELLADEQSPGLVPRPIHIQLDSPRQLLGATIRLRLPANAILQGYRARRVLEWQADIPAGGNRLSLPLLVPADAEGTILLEVEHGGARKALRLPLPSAPGNDSVETITTT